MRHAQIIVVMVALLTTPLALLARGIACDNCTCTSMCCMPHGQHSPNMGMMCHGSAEKMQCGPNSRHKALDFGFIAPIAPTHAMSMVKLIVPAPTRRTVTNYIQLPLSRALSAPLEPPRS